MTYNIYKNEFDTVVLNHIRKTYKVESESEKMINLDEVTEEDCETIASCMFRTAEDCKSIYPDMRTADEEMAAIAHDIRVEIVDSLCHLLGTHKGECLTYAQQQAFDILRDAANKLNELNKVRTID